MSHVISVFEEVSAFEIGGMSDVNTAMLFGGCVALSQQHSAHSSPSPTTRAGQSW